MKKYLLAIVLVFVGVYLLDGHCTTSRFKDSKSKKIIPTALMMNKLRELQKTSTTEGILLQLTA